MTSKHKRRARGRYAAVLLAGVLWALSFPKPSIAGFAWVAPGLMLAAALGTDGRSAFRLGYLTGLIYHLISLYWLLLIPIQLEPGTSWLTGHLYKIGPVVGWLALSGFLALYPGSWVWLCWRLYPAHFDSTGTDTTPLVDQFLRAGRVQRMSWTVACAALWVAWEMIQARFLSGFPWNLLGASQYQMLPIIQIASITGVYGVAFLMVWFSVSLIGAGALMLRQPVRRESWMLELMLPLLGVAGVVTFGMHKLREPQPAEGKLTVALIQPSIPQTLIWEPAAAQERFRKVIQLSEQALTKGHPELLVWPEAAVPGFARWSTNAYDAITNLVRQHEVWMILGSDDVARAEHPESSEDYVYFNSAFLVRPDGEFVADYRKRKLVIFGEYVPLGRVLPFLKYFTPISGGFTPGQRPIPFVLPDLGVRTSVLICFEDVFPQLVREYVDDQTDFLMNLTNDGWFDESAAQWQHAGSAALRAIENGLPLVRCANNGLSCWVDACGRLHDVDFPGTKDIYGAGYKLVTVPTLAGAKHDLTIYTRYGDWFGWSCVGLTGVLLASHWVSRRRQPA